MEIFEIVFSRTRIHEWELVLRLLAAVAFGGLIGLTTGAGMWLAGAIGVAAGTGRYSIAVFVTILAIVILTGLQRLSNRLASSNSREEEPNASRPK